MTMVIPAAWPELHLVTGSVVCYTRFFEPERCHERIMLDHRIIVFLVHRIDALRYSPA
jgi:hypothetical protein